MSIFTSPYFSGGPVAIPAPDPIPTPPQSPVPADLAALRATLRSRAQKDALATLTADLAAAGVPTT